MTCTVLRVLTCTPACTREFIPFTSLPAVYEKVYSQDLYQHWAWDSKQNKTKQSNKLKQVRWDSLIPILQTKTDSEPGPVLRFPYGLIHVLWGFPSNQYVGDPGLMPLTDHFWGLLGSLGWWPLARSSLLCTHSSFSSHHCIHIA